MAFSILELMLRPEAMALELLEYKIGDLVAGYEPTGGHASVAALHDYLAQLKLSLDGEAQQRFSTASQELERLGLVEPVRTTDLDVPPGLGAELSFDQLELGISIAEEAAKQVLATEAAILLSPAELEEQRILKQLAKRVRALQVERALKRLAATYRAERERYAVRLLYSTLRNLARYAQKESFAKDVTLVHFEVEEAVLERSDPLYSFNDLESVTELLRELANVVLNFWVPKSPYRALELDEDQALAYVRRMALAVARDPYAGRLSSLPSQDLSAQQLRQMISALSKEPISESAREAQRRALEARLQAAWERERAQRTLFERDVAAFTQAAEMVFAQLAPHLPKHVGGEAEEPRLTDGVLFAENPARNLTEIPRRAASLTLRLKGPTRFTLAGLNLAVVGSPSAWTLALPGEHHALSPKTVFESGDRRVVALLEEDYLYLNVRENARSLPELVAEALAVHMTLHLDFTDLLRMAVGVPPGEPQAVARLAVAQLRRLVAHAPDARRALEGLCTSAAKASGVAFVGSTKEAFLRHLHLAVSGPDEALLRSLKGVRYQLLDEPLNLRVAGYPLTVRRYDERATGVRESAVVVMPDAPLGAFNDYGLFELAEGTLLCALAEGEFAAIYLKGEAAQTLHL